MLEDKVQPALVDMTFRFLHRMTHSFNRWSLPVISTGRSFSYYRKIFFDHRPASAVLRELQGQCILDIGCGLTPHVSNSMFQACHRQGVDFYGIDPKLEQGFKLGAFDRAKIRGTGWGRIIRDAPGLDKAIGTMADDLPFADNSVDLILSCYLLYAWLNDEDLLEGIYNEFHRVLKPGGQVMIFPAPHYALANIQHPGLRKTMEEFSVEQEFFSGLSHRTQFPPAYMRSLIKR